MVARLAVERCAELTITIKALEKEITELTTQLAPALLELPGCGALTAAKIIGETAGVDRFKSVTPTPVSTEPHRCRCGRRTRPGTG